MIKKNKLKFILLGTIICNTLFADDFDIDNLLNNIEKKTDLSEKTKLANSGVSFIYTRDDINRMQIKNLKDILKSVYPIGYNENRYGIPDPFSYGSNHPFLSSPIKVFIDNQEISVGLYGSGLSIMGDIDIQFIDHIEIYTNSPTYEYSTEATITLIKLYTKSAKKDEGGKVEIGSDNYGSLNLNGYYTQELEQWSYFAFVSNYNENRKKYYSHETEISRDKDTSLTVATLQKDNHNILLTAKTQKRDAFINASIDGSPTSSKIDSDFVHIGYDTKVDNISYLLTYDYMKTKAKMSDDVTAIPTAPYYGMFPVKLNETDTTSDVFTGEIKYNLKTNKNSMTTGVKYRAKRYRFDKAAINGIDLPTTNNDLQTIATLFLENQYSLNTNSIITAGTLYSIVNNNHSIQDDNMLSYRLGYTYTNNLFEAKTIASSTKTTLDPYLINSTTFLATPSKHYKPQETNGIVENIIYEKENNKYELILDYTLEKNYLISNNQGKLETFDKDMIMKGIDTRWTYHYNEYDKLFLI